MCIKYSMKFSNKMRNDFILIGALFIFAIVILLVVQLTKTNGNYAVVVSNGEEVDTYSLKEDNEITLRFNDEFNVLVIKDGYAFIKDASCPDKLCVKQGKVHSSGETLVCLPNKTTVKIVSRNNDDELDLIS